MGTVNSARQSAMPNWLTRHLEHTGMLDADGVHRNAGYGQCHQCRTRLLIGLDAEPCGLIARVDPWPISALSEFMAIATGRWTYNLARSATSRGKRAWNIDRRYAEHISGTRKHTVVAQHRCGAPLPADNTMPPRIPARMDTDEPPF